MLWEVVLCEVGTPLGICGKCWRQSPPLEVSREISRPGTHCSKLISRWGSRSWGSFPSSVIPDFPKSPREALQGCDSSGFSLQVVLGGGQEAMDVTTTSTRIGKFEARLVLFLGEMDL